MSTDIMPAPPVAPAIVFGYHDRSMRRAPRGGLISAGRVAVYEIEDMDALQFLKAFQYGR